MRVSFFCLQKKKNKQLDAKTGQEDVQLCHDVKSMETRNQVSFLEIVKAKEEEIQV